MTANASIEKKSWRQQNRTFSSASRPLNHSPPAEVRLFDRLFDRLFTDPQPDTGDKDFRALLNPASKQAHPRFE